VKTEVSPAAENEVVLSVEVSEEAVARMYERTLTRLSREIQIPGFRKGRVPRDIVVSRLGEDYVRGETLNDALPHWYDEALKEAAVDAVSMPQLELGEFDHTAAFSFKATVQVRPTPVLGEYKGLEVPRREAEVTDGQVEAQLAMLQERFASLQPVEDRPVQQGDFVLMDLAGSKEGEPIEGAQANDYMAQIGRGNLIPGFEEALEGVASGEKKSFDVTFPDDYHAEELQGTPAMVDEQAHHLLHELEEDIGERGLTMDSYLAVLQKTREEVEEELRPRAEHNIKRRLVLEAVVQAEGLEVSDDEVRERIKVDAEILGRDPSQLVLDVYKSGRHEQLREELLMAKAIDLIAESAVPVPLEDDAENGDLDEAAETEEPAVQPEGE
jgi:trigger factor